MECHIVYRVPLKMIFQVVNYTFSGQGSVFLLDEAYRTGTYHVTTSLQTEVWARLFEQSVG